jgi:peroxiredoxin
MAKTASTMLSLGTRAPDFTLTDVRTHRPASLRDFEGKQALLIMFICNHCPYVVHVRGQFKNLEADYARRGLQIVAINANSALTHPQDGPEPMRELAAAEGWGFPFLYDESQEVAKAYRAACTPDFFLFDSDLRLVYRGQLDDARPGTDAPVTGRDLRAALDAVLAGRPVSSDQRPSAGCNIKWHPGQEPDYA